MSNQEIQSLTLTLTECLNSSPCTLPCNLLSGPAPISTPTTDSKFHLRLSTHSVHVHSHSNSVQYSWERKKPNKQTNKTNIGRIKDCLLLQHVVEPTSVRGNENPSTLYLFFIDEENMVYNFQICWPLWNDHHSILISLCAEQNDNDNNNDNNNNKNNIKAQYNRGD